MGGHSLLEAEHAVMAIMRVGRRIGVVGVAVVVVEELDDVESEPVHIEVDVARLEIGRAGLSDADFGVEPFDGAPRGLSDSHAVVFGTNEEEFKFAAVAARPYHKAADLPSVLDDAIGLATVD